MWLVSGGFQIASGWFQLWFQMVSRDFRWFQDVLRFSKYGSNVIKAVKQLLAATEFASNLTANICLLFTIQRLFDLREFDFVIILFCLKIFVSLFCSSGLLYFFFTRVISQQCSHPKIIWDSSCPGNTQKTNLQQFFVAVHWTTSTLLEKLKENNIARVGFLKLLTNKNLLVHFHQLATY